MFDWKGVIKAVAPALAWALPGPLGPMAQKVIAKALGTPEDSTEKVLAEKVASATPDDLLALHKADQEFALQMRGMDIDYEKVAAEDRANARAREIATKDWVVKFLAVGALAIYATVVLALFYVPIPPANRDAIMAAFGILSGIVSGSVFNYYFGSSSGSARKTDVLAEAARK